MCDHPRMHGIHFIVDSKSNWLKVKCCEYIRRATRFGTMTQRDYSEPDPLRPGPPLPFQKSSLPAMTPVARLSLVSISEVEYSVNEDVYIHMREIHLDPRTQPILMLTHCDFYTSKPLSYSTAYKLIM